MSPDLTLSPPPAEVSLLEVTLTSRVNRPVVTLAIDRPSSLDEAVIEGEVVPDGVPPARAPVPEVEVVVEDVLVDVRQHKLLLGAAQNGHADEADVGVLGLRLLWEGDPEESGIQLGHREVGKVGGRAEVGGKEVCWELPEGGEG